MAEIVFFACFLIFVVGVLLLDTLVIDKTAHEVSMKEAGIWTAVWIVLALLFSAFLWFHGDMVHGIENFEDLQSVCSRYAAHITLNPNDFEQSLQQYRHYMTISYISGYLLEKTLSVDNLFVMMMIFTSFGVSKKEYQHVLNWGIFGAIVLRFMFIFLGSAILSKFSWVLYIFGLFLLYSGAKMFFEKKDNEAPDVANHPVVKFLSKHFRVTNTFCGDNFFVRNGGKLFITPLLVTVVFIEFSDLVFAFDSIPAIFSITLDPYVVFFSNIFAILGLRAMFFLLAGVADRFWLLKPGVAFLLLFIGVKLLIHDLFEIKAEWSLVFILTVIFISIIGSLIFKKKA